MQRQTAYHLRKQSFNCFCSLFAVTSPIALHASIADKTSISGLITGIHRSLVCSYLEMYMPWTKSEGLSMVYCPKLIDNWRFVCCLTCVIFSVGLKTVYEFIFYLHITHYSRATRFKPVSNIRTCCPGLAWNYVLTTPVSTLQVFAERVVYLRTQGRFELSPPVTSPDLVGALNYRDSSVSIRSSSYLHI